MNAQLLREYFKCLLNEIWEDRKDIGKKVKDAEEELTKLDRPKLKGMAYADSVEVNREEEIVEMMELPEYASVEAFASFLYDDERESFTDVELQAVARNETGIHAPNAMQVRNVKDDLIGYGFTFVPRQPVKQFRGARSNAHGTHPFAGSGGGGTGFSSGGLGLGTGPGAIGGKTPWDANSTKNLPMGSKRK